MRLICGAALAISRQSSSPAPIGLGDVLDYVVVMKKNIPHRVTVYADLIDLISRSIDEARGKGRDYLGQNQHAVNRVMMVRPDMTVSDASSVVNELRST